jgi:hypothetical protein
MSPVSLPAILSSSYFSAPLLDSKNACRLGK